MAQKLLLATCQREGSFANALIGGKIKIPTQESSTNFQSVVRDLNYIIGDMRTERGDLQKKLQTRDTEIL
jgi:hypothetical protein